MRDTDTIDFGVDLGTTNSTIAMVEDGDVVVIKNNDGWDVTPSAVWLPKPDVVHVGRRARERVETDPDNTAAEFKLEMGLADARHRFAKAGVELSPQQLSAEVLKSLRADAAHHFGQAPEFAVITVPAAFALNQNKATTEAAALAGFNPACPLVQEPTAAAFAYGFHDAADPSYWMVFDFGGGTFDAAVVSKRDGDLRVLNHAGDRYLGGKLIDWALVERVLAPAVTRELGFRDLRRDNVQWRRTFGRLKAAAEDAKIQLSRRSSVDIVVDLSDPQGKMETFEYTLNRHELDEIAEPFYARAVNLCKAALHEASLSVDDIDKLVLVGGATLAPGLRDRLTSASGIGIELDTSLDPTTVVARGAAIFASTIRRPAVRTAQPVAPNEFLLELAYEPSVTTTLPAVGGRVTSKSTMDLTGYGVTLHNPDGLPPYRSPKVLLNAKGAFVTEVAIDEHTTSRFTVELTDPAGAPQRVTPDSFTITHRDVEFGGVRLTHSLGVQLADREFAPLLRKGTTLPTRAREVFRTTNTLRRTESGAVVRAPIVQGERRRADRNSVVGILEIRSRDVRMDLPAGTEIEVVFEVDTANQLTVVVDVPVVDEQFEVEINLDSVHAPDPQVLQVQLNEAESRLATLRGSAAGADVPVADRLLAKLEEENAVAVVREHVRAAKVDVGAAAVAENLLRDLQADLDDVQDAVELPLLVRQLHEMLTEAAALADQVGTSQDQAEVTDLRRRAEEAITAEDPAAVRTQAERTATFLFELERRGPDWPVKLFYGLQDLLPASNQAGDLVKQGKQAIAAHDVRALDAVNQRLIRLLPQDDRDKIIGLRKV